MRTLTHALAVAAALVGSAAQAQPVSYFVANPQEREALLLRCMDDEALARQPQCANASRAASQAGRQGGGRRTSPQPIPTPQQRLTSRTYYAENPLAREVTLSQCSRGLVPMADCNAARAAGR